MWTTSRYASEKTREKAKSLAQAARSIFIARGKKTIEQLVDLARRAGDERIMVVEESAGAPSGIRCIEVLPSGCWRWAGKTRVDEHESKR